MGEVTTLKVHKETREKLAELGTKREIYDDIIRRLIQFYLKRDREKGHK